MTERDEVQPSESNDAGASAREQDVPSVETSPEARNMAMLCHIFGAVGFIGPLMIWLSEREKHRFVAQHGQAAINYQISLMIYSAACAVLIPIFVGVILSSVLAIVHVVLIIMGAVKASQGESYRYPIAIDFVK